MSNILEEIKAEREYQITKWGNDADDTVNTPNDFVTYITGYATKWFPGGFFPIQPEATDKFRECMIKTAALAVAAAESVDRQRETQGHTFYEQQVGA